MTGKHTPGPWRWVPQPDYSWQYQDLMSASGEVVLSGEEAPDPSGIEISHADARLIEAAPELLQEVEWLLGAHLDAIRAYAAFFEGQPNPEDDKDVIRVRALIAKARGTQ